MYRLTTETILKAYETGWFPMADTDEPGEPIHFYTARRRGVIPVDTFRMPKRARRKIKSKGYTKAVNTCFEDVIRGCARRANTWISEDIIDLFTALHHQGHAHSVEVFADDKLVAGLYGIAMGGAYFAESVFQDEPEAHKAALLFCHQHLVEREFVLWDVQFFTEHLSQFGCIQIPDHTYEKLLKKALKLNRSFD